MLNNLLQSIRSYADQHKALEEALEQKKKQLAEWYRGDMYKEQVAKETEAFNIAIEKLKNIARTSVTQEIQEAKNRIRSVIAKPMSVEQLNLVQTAKLLKETGGLTALEKREIMDKCKGNYLATRMLTGIMGLENATSTHNAEGMIARLDEVDKNIQDYVIASSGFTTKKSSLQAAMILDGKNINDIKSQVDSFSDTYQAE